MSKPYLAPPNPEIIRVVLAEDHHVVRAAVAELLTKEADIEVVGEVADAADLLPAVQSLNPHVLVLDAHMPGHQVIHSAERVHENHPQVKILVLSGYERREYVTGLLRAGATGYVLKHDSPDMLVQAVRSVAQGDEWLSPRVAKILVSNVRSGADRQAAALTPRESDVLRLMASGYKNIEIADALVITNQTVKNYVRSIFSKLGVQSRVEAVLYAVDQGLAPVTTEERLDDQLPDA